jgi:hypothetical protein
MLHATKLVLLGNSMILAARTVRPRCYMLQIGEKAETLKSAGATECHVLKV